MGIKSELELRELTGMPSEHIPSLGKKKNSAKLGICK